MDTGQGDRQKDGDQKVIRRSRSRSRTRSRDRGHRRDRVHSRDGYARRKRSRSSKSRSRSRDYNTRRPRSPSDNYHHNRSSRRSPSPGDRDRSRPSYQDRRPSDSLRSGGHESSDPPPIHSIHHARVVSVRPFGAFVNLKGYRSQALVHHTQVAEDVVLGRDDDDEMKVKALEFFVPPGEEVWVKIVEVREENQGGGGRGGFKLAASMKAVDQETGADLDPDNLLQASNLANRDGGLGGGGGGGSHHQRQQLSDAPPELHSLHKATVKQLKPFGIFVQLEGYRRYGLVHFSQISDHLFFTADDNDAERIAGIGQVVNEGEHVYVKVVEVGEDERGVKIGCSMKVVNQRTGEDMDPTNLRYKPREGGGGGGGGGAGMHGQRIGSAAAAVVAQTATIDWGHMKADVVQYGGAGAKTYELLAEEEEEDKAPKRPGGQQYQQHQHPAGGREFPGEPR